MTLSLNYTVGPDDGKDKGGVNSQNANLKTSTLDLFRHRLFSFDMFNFMMLI